MAELGPRQNCVFELYRGLHMILTPYLTPHPPYILQFFFQKCHAGLGFDNQGLKKILRIVK